MIKIDEKLPVRNVTSYGHRITDKSNTPSKTSDSSLLQNVQTGSGANTAPYSVGPGGPLPGSNAAETWGWSLTPSGTETTNEWRCSSIRLCSATDCTGATVIFENKSYKTIRIGDDITECSLIRHWIKEFLHAPSRSNTATVMAETGTGFCGPKGFWCQKSDRQSTVIAVSPPNTFLGLYNKRYKPDFRRECGSFPYRYQNKQLRHQGMNNTRTGITKCAL
jgi:hypothetical protein